MMLQRSFIRLLPAVIFILSIFFLSRCAKPPSEEIVRAEDAVEDARQKGAVLYAEDAIRLAQDAVSLIEPNKEKMKVEAEQMLTDLKMSIDELKTLVSQAVRKKAQVDREEIQGMIGKWEVEMVSIKEKLREQQVRQAYDGLVEMREQSSLQKGKIAAALETAAEKK